MNVWAAVVGLSLSGLLPLIPSPAEAPMYFDSKTNGEFYSVGESDFKYRWLSDSEIDSHDLECELYALCSWVEIDGPVCPNETWIALDYMDGHGEPITSGGDVLPATSRSRKTPIEVGSNWVREFASFEVSDISCYQGLPTGYSNL